MQIFIFNSSYTCVEPFMHESRARRSPLSRFYTFLQLGFESCIGFSFLGHQNHSCSLFLSFLVACLATCFSFGIIWPSFWVLALVDSSSSQVLVLVRLSLFTKPSFTLLPFLALSPPLLVWVLFYVCSAFTIRLV